MRAIDLARNVINEMKINPVITLCLVGATVCNLIWVLSSIYLLLWVQSFVKGPDNTDLPDEYALKSKDEGKVIF